MAGKKSKADKSKRPVKEARTNARKNRNVISQNLPKFEKNEDGTLNRDKPLIHDEGDAQSWRAANEKNGAFGKYANMKKKKTGAKKKASRDEEDE